MKTNIKKLGIRIILALFLSFTFAGFFNTAVSFAAPLVCPTTGSWVSENGNCTNTNKDLLCPVGNKDISETTKTVCKPTPAVPSTEEEKALKNTAYFLVSVQNFLNKLIWPVLVMIGGLLDNSLLFGNGMEERLRAIWIPMRNLVNILFVIVLVGIALYNVLGIGEDSDNYALKAILPKILIGIIAVNFSFLGIKVFLDSINVLTTSVFSLPSQVQVGLDKVLSSENPEDQKIAKNFCKAVEISGGALVTSFAAGGDNHDQAAELLKGKEQEIYYKVGNEYLSGLKTNAKKEQIIQKANETLTLEKKKAFDKKLATELAKLNTELCQGDTLSDAGQAFLSKWNSRNAALAMVLNMTNLVFYKDIDFSVVNASTLVINTLFSAMMYVIYVASFLALFVVLLARMVVLWLAIVMSPVLLLGMTVPLIKEKVSAFGDIQDKFVQNAIAPLTIGLAMTVGWIMLQGIQSINGFDRNSALNFNTLTGFPVMGLNDLQNLVVALGTVAVVWLAVFAAASKSIAAPVTDAIKGAVQRVGTFVGTVPLKNMPFMPITLPSGETMKASLPQLVETARTLEQGPSHTERQKLNQFLNIGNTLPDFKDILSAKKKEDVYNQLRTHKTTLERGDAATMQTLKKLRTQNPSVFGSLDVRIQKLIDELNAIDPADPDPAKIAERKRILRDLYSQPLISGATDLSSGAAPSTPPTPAAPPAIDPTATYGKKADGTPSTVADLKAPTLKIVQKQVTDLKAIVNDNTKQDVDKKAAIIKQFPGFTTKDKAGKPVKPTASDLKGLIGDDDYAKLIGIFGTDEAINVSLGNPPTPPAPANP